MAEIIELTDENFESTLQSVPLAIVDYYATWCGACRMAAPLFRRVAEEAGLPIYKIDAEKNPGSRNGVTITNLPTIALFEAGRPKAAVSTAKEEGLKDFVRDHGAYKG
jgi:thioredoxin 1